MKLAEKELRIALLIDADNAPAKYIDDILTELSTLGVINVRRAYGNWTKPALNGWQEKLLEYAIRPIQQFDYSTRKNATDMAMTVDAMELLYADRPDAFGIVSSDADFTPLVMHLRSKGAAVYGFGAAQTPKPFVNACSRFLYVEAIGAPAAPGSLVEVEGESSDPVFPQPSNREVAKKADEVASPGVPMRSAALRVPTAQLRHDTRLMALLRDAVNASRDEDGWARVGAVGTHIANKASFDSRNYGYATLSKLLVATQAFDLREEGSPRVAVRDKRQTDQAASALATTSLPRSPSQPSGQPKAKVLPLNFGREPQPVIVRPEIHALRAALAAMAVQRVSVADILIAVPELLQRHPFALPGVYARLREKRLLRPSGSGRRLFERHDGSFRLLLDEAQVQTVQYIG